VKKNRNLIFCFALLLTACASQVFAGPKNWSEGKTYAPIQQLQFCDLTEKYRQSLGKAFASNNDIKVNLAKKQRQLDLDALMPGGQFKNWVVKVVSVKQVVASSNPEIDGDAAVVLELWCGTQIGSGMINFNGNSVWGATIDYGSREYRETAKFQLGNFAIVSGNFMRLEDFVPNAKETFYATRPLTSVDLQHASNKMYSNGSELFLAKISYLASAN
tara:strand:+ start:205 stop:855 length:651 start_codon:yes stop_codon:yes gene_type:complete